jgi:hypothetical protein
MPFFAFRFHGFHAIRHSALFRHEHFGCRFLQMMAAAADTFSFFFIFDYLFSPLSFIFDISLPIRYD